MAFHTQHQKAARRRRRAKVKKAKVMARRKQRLSRLVQQKSLLSLKSNKKDILTAGRTETKLKIISRSMTRKWLKLK